MEDATSENPHRLSRQVATYISRNSSADDQKRSLNSIAWNLQEGIVRLQDLITNLGESLTSTDEDERARAALLLGEVITLAQGSMQPASTHEHVVQFLSSRLTDWPSIHGCLTGITGLQAAGAIQLQANQTTMLVNSMLEVQVTSLPQADRMMALTILLRALQANGKDLLESGVDMMQGVIAAVDGEKDPRCLMLSFQLAQQVVCVYEQASAKMPVAQQSLDANKEELFDVIACYFPISFSPPPNSVHSITRQDLAAALLRTLTCTPLFAPFFLPMLVEKLSSSLRQAKLDALAGLSAAAEGYGPTGFQPYLSMVWLALRAELLAPAAPALLPADLASAQQVAEKAAECLTQTIAALSGQGNTSLAKTVLADEQVCGDLLGCLSGSKQQDSQDPCQQVNALVRVVAAVAEASLPACQMTCKQLLPTLATAASDGQTTRQSPSQQQQQPDLTQQLALSAMLAIVKAAVKVASLAGGQEDAMAGKGSAVFAAITITHRQHSQGQTGSTSDVSGISNGSGQGGDAEMQDGAVAVQDMSLKELAGAADSQHGSGDSNAVGDAEQDEGHLLRLRVLTELVSFPKASCPLSAQALEEALHEMLHCINRSGSHDDAAAAQATSALARLAGADHLDLLEKAALGPLLEGATETRAEQQGNWQGALPLQALATLATPQYHLRTCIVTSIQQLLPALLAAAINNEHNQQMLVGVLHILCHKLAPFAEKEGEIAKSIGLDLLTGMVQLTAAGQAAGEDVCTACAEAVQAAVAGCGPAHQLPLCQLACEQLTQSCNQLSHTAGVSLSSHPLSHLNGHTSNQQSGRPTMHPSEEDQSTPGSASQSMAVTAGSSIVHSLHPAQQVLQLLTQSAVVSAAAVTALRPGVLPHDRALPLLKCLVRLAMGLPEGSCREACMVAAAAIVNKWPADVASLDNAMASLLQLLGIGDLAQAATNSQAKLSKPHSCCSFTCLAWLIKGACMAGHKPALPLTALPLSYLACCARASPRSTSKSASADAQPAAGGSLLIPTAPSHAKLQTEQQSEGLPADSACVQAAAATFELVPSTQASSLAFSKDMAHVIVKPLWQQRFYTIALQQLEKLLTQSQSTASLSADAQASQGHMRQGPLLLALAYLLKGTPVNISKADILRLLGWLLTALNVLQHTSQCNDKDAIAGLLKLVKTVVEDPTGRAAIEPEVQRLVSTLISLSSYEAMDMRMCSLQCLVAVMDLPYHLLHPLRKQVLAALALHVDDKKRCVRQEAVKCLKVWSNA